MIGLLITVSLAVPAWAHGPSVAVAYRGIEPPTLTIRVGDKVHFRNVNPTGSPCTLVLDDGSAILPTLTRSEGWHHGFEKPGHFAFYVKEMPSAKGVIVVVSD